MPIEIPKFRYDPHGIPILSKQQLETYALYLLSISKTISFSEPMVFDVEKFIEYTLEYDLHYDHLSHNGCILGAATFSPCLFPVYDPVAKEAKEIFLPNKTILIDCSLDCGKKQALCRFSLAHEAAHTVLHPYYYQQHRAIACMRQDIDFDNIHSRPPRILTTPLDWLEYQANYLAGALLINKPMLDKLVGNIPYNPDFSYIFNLSLKVAEFFKVSQSAAEARLSNVYGLRY